MAGRDERQRLMREAAQARRESEALAEVREAAAAMRDAQGHGVAADAGAARGPDRPGVAAGAVGGVGA
jgi:hypothetical protein